MSGVKWHKETESEVDLSGTITAEFLKFLTPLFITNNQKQSP